MELLDKIEHPLLVLEKFGAFFFPNFIHHSL
jgi:hypothetical protein